MSRPRESPVSINAPFGPYAALSPCLLLTPTTSLLYGASAPGFALLTTSLCVSIWVTVSLSFLSVVRRVVVCPLMSVLSSAIGGGFGVGGFVFIVFCAYFFLLQMTSSAFPKEISSTSLGIWIL